MKKSADEISKIGTELFNSMDSCRLCPQECGIDRFNGEFGKCHTGTEPVISNWNLHFGEEPPLSSGKGSGTIFMTNCNLFCKYCQNHSISQEGEGKEITVGQLADIMLKLQDRGADNINLVTPTHQVALLVMALAEAASGGLSIPVVYNTSGYEKAEIIAQLDGIIDIYLVDMRYNSSDTARELSGCFDYTEINRKAVSEMFRQTGILETDRNGMAEKGLMVRHLVLPNELSGSDGIFNFLADEISKDVYVSLMSQYYPSYRASDDGRLNRRLTGEEFSNAKDAFYRAGLKNGHIQDYML